QIGMLQEAYDSIYDDADKIYVYGACEGSHMGVGFFYEKDNKVFDSRDIYVMAEQNDDTKGLLSRSGEMLDLLKSLVSICKEYNRPMPTEIKIYYDCNQHRMDSECQYEPVFSFDEDKIPHDVFTEWVEETKKLKGQ
ncbi:MAG: hypothetical protein Q4B40_06705, partial [Clostridia bacterium]|nr:hypothetical protein [Clostridia bacterium]